MPPRAHRPRGGPARLGHRPPDALWQRAARPASHGGHAWVSTAATGPCSPAASPTPVYADFSGGGIPAATISRADLVALVSTALSEFTATQHISPNHVIEFDASDPGRAICHSYMYARHLLRGSENGEFYLLRGSYTNHMLRTPDGWRIERIIQHRSWEYGNTSAVTEATARAQAQAPASQANR